MKNLFSKLPLKMTSAANQGDSVMDGYYEHFKITEVDPSSTKFPSGDTPITDHSVESACAPTAWVLRHSMMIMDTTLL